MTHSPHQTGNILQWIQIGLALMIAYLVYENGQTQMDTLAKGHKEIMEQITKLP